MTETQWYSGTNPHEMLTFLKDQSGTGLAGWLARLGLRRDHGRARKFQLFACACCRRIWPLLGEPASRHAVEVAEQYAEGQASRRALHQAVEEARAASLQMARPRVMVGGWLAAAQARAAEAVACTLEAEDPADEAATWGKEAIRAWATRTPGTKPGDSLQMPVLPHQPGSPEAAWVAEGIAQCEILRDLFGNPFRAPPQVPACRSSEAIALAESIVKNRDFASLPALADLLEKAGCPSLEILNHCREKRDHVHGCWALDYVLGKG